MNEDPSSEGPIQPKKSIFREYAEAILVAVVLIACKSGRSTADAPPCSNCGSHVVPGARFCHQCGSSLEGPS